MTLRYSFPGPDGLATTTDGALDFAGSVVRNSNGSVRAGAFYRGADTLLTGVASTWTVNVARFEAVLSRSLGGAFLLNNDSVLASPVNTQQAPAANSRIDVLYVKQNIAASPYSDSGNAPVLGWQYGTASATPTKPSISAIDGALELGTVQIPSTATGLTSSGVVVTTTVPWTSSSGGVVVLRSAAEETAFPGTETQLGFRLDQGIATQVTGGRWVADGAYAELDASPVLADTGTVQNISMSLNTTRSNRPDDVVQSVSGVNISIYPGLYDVSASVSLNNAGSAQPVSARSFIEFLVTSISSIPQSRSTVMSGEDLWSTAGVFRVTGASSVVGMLRVFKQTGGNAGSNIKLRLTRIGS